MNSAPTPSIGRSVALLALASSAALALRAMPLSRPPFALQSFAEWWDLVGTANATVALIHSLGFLVAGWLAIVAALGVISSSTRSARAYALWRRAAPATISRVLVASTVTLGASAPAIGAAVEATDDRPVLIDLGPAESDGPVTTPPRLVDLGPVDIGLVDVESDAAAATLPVADEWTVRPGDHLWAIAAATLSDRGRPVSDVAVAQYWRQLIRHNASSISDPDLIHPGLILQLPS